MNVPSDISGLVPFLVVLDLPTNKVPTLEATRKAYRSKLHLHPDKSGDEFNDVFKKITEAVSVINLFISDNVEHSDAAADSRNKEDDRELLLMLEKKTDFHLTKVLTPCHF